MVQNKVLSNNWEDLSNNNSTEQNDIDNSQGPATDTLDNNTSQTNNNLNQGNNEPTTTPGNKSTVGQVVIPYTKGVIESMKHICGKYGIQVHFKDNTTIKQVLMRPKDQDPKCSTCVKYKSSFWMGEHGTSWIMTGNALVENKVFRTNFIHLVYTSWSQLQGF